MCVESRERECVSREVEVLSNIERQHKQAAAQAGSSLRKRSEGRRGGQRSQIVYLASMCSKVGGGGGGQFRLVCLALKLQGDNEATS